MVGNGIVGILKELNNKWERRAPVTPQHCAKLICSGDVNKIIVQPCTKRIYRDIEYEDAGCEISEDLSPCALILGVKQPKLGTLLEDRAYAFFSHTHKARPQNMPILDEVLNKRVLLYDYELIVDENGKRLVAFGEYAGRAGMIDFLRGLGERLLSLGYSTPFLSLGSSYMYISLSAAKSAVLMVGDAIASSGLPQEICPLVFVFTGSGNVSKGAQEILRLLPHEYIDPSKLKDISKHKLSKRKVYASVVTAEHMVAPNNPNKHFSKADYYAHPEEYHSIFHETIAPYASVIVNCMYWEHRYPQLLTNQQMYDMFKEGHCKLLGISDITCDVEGSIECLKTTTSIEQPFFRYNPVARTYHKDLDGEGVVFLAVDILPTEFAKEATNHFGNVLYPFLSTMAHCQNPEDASSPLRRSCIAYHGHLTHLFEYIQRIRNSEDRVLYDNGRNVYHTKVSLSGHLFDKFLINEALDVIEAAGGNFRIATCEIGQTSDDISYAEIEVAADSEGILSRIVDSLSMIATQSSSTEHSSQMEGDEGFKVVILGAGRMCEPAVSYLATADLEDSNHVLKSSQGAPRVCVGSLFLDDALKVSEGISNAEAAQVDVMDEKQLKSFIQQAEVVISLLPPSFHERIAMACIELKRHLVTASYVSENMASLHTKAQEAGITLLCEMGLDPGIDHMMAMKMIHTAHEKGGKVNVFESYCGGLPSPEAANNPLGYKFSWNPSGAIKAGRNSAIYKQGGKIVQVPGESLFASAVPFRIPEYPAYALEMIPNRDSLQYGELYGISQEAQTIFRATLRYEGFSHIMDSLGNLGYYNTDNHPLLTTSPKPTYLHVYKALLQQLSIDESRISKRVLNCIRFLGLDSHNQIPDSCSSLFEVLCSQMESKLVFKQDEQDMVIMHHVMEIIYEGSRPSEKHSATLLTMGETEKQVKDRNPETAMAKTVGLTAAIGAQLLLTGRIKARGVVRPLEPEVYLPGLELLEKHGVRLEENIY